MIRLGVIGLGTIYDKQRMALNYLSDKYKVIATCDINSEKRSNALDDVPFFQRVDDLLLISEVETVLIATPPYTHFDLASAALKAHKHVLLEKPAVFSMAKLDELYKLADENNVLLQIAYHASFAADLEWYLDNAWQISSQYNLGKLKKIECGFFDPYMVDGKIMANKELLGGSFIDSGVNELSVCDRLTDISGFKCIEDNVKDKDQVVYSSTTKFSDGDIEIVITTGWDRMLNEKTTELTFADTDIRILLHHSNQQAIIIDGKNEKVLYEDDKMERLVRHYYRVFMNFDSAFHAGVDNRESSVKIHRLLLGE